MTTQKKKVKETLSETRSISTTTSELLIFISHDSRDAELAEAFSKLLKNVSAGMLKSFRSSDKKGTEGFDFGDEWYNSLMTKLQSASDVVCLFTERSLDRPWILYEAGVAKGSLKTSVYGLALGIPRSRISSGPFYNFHNMDDSEDELTKLIHQLARKTSIIEIVPEVLKGQIKEFKSTVDNISKNMVAHNGKSKKVNEEEDSIAKLVEEMKTLPSRITERIIESGDPFRRRRLRRFHPMMIEDILHMTEDPNDPIGLLIGASFIKDDFPWYYELVYNIYEKAKSGDFIGIEQEISKLQRISKFIMKGPFFEELGLGFKENHIFFMEFPMMLERMLKRSMEDKNTPRTPKRKPQKLSDVMK